jgi:hypothetical protein
VAVETLFPAFQQPRFVRKLNVGFPKTLKVVEITALVPFSRATFYVDRSKRFQALVLSEIVLITSIVSFASRKMLRRERFYPKRGMQDANNWLSTAASVSRTSS